MAITYKSQGAGASSETSGAAVSRASPATVDAGDFLLVHAYFEGTATTPSTPSGFTLLDGPRVIESTIGRHWLYGKIADGSEDGAANALGTDAVTTMRSGRCYSFAGRTSGTITQLVKGFAATSHATDPQMPTVVTTVAGALAVAFVAQNDNNAFASATGESGGDWVEAVAEYTVALTPGLSLGIQTCTPTSDPGTVSGGSIATTNDPCGVIGCQILAAPEVTLESNADSVSFTEGIAKVVNKLRAETVAFTEAFVRKTNKAVAEAVSLTENLAAVKVVVRAIGDSVSFTEAFVKQTNKRVAETVSFTESRLLTVSRGLTDTLGLTENLTKTRTKAVADAVALAEAIALATSRRLSETAGLTENLGTSVIPGGGGGGTPAVQRMSIAIALRLG